MFSLFAMPNRTTVYAAICGAAILTGAGLLGISYLDDRRIDADIREIISMLPLSEPFHQQADGVRTFINDNSIHRVDDVFRANHSNMAAFSGGILAHAMGKAPPVHMECSTRTNLMSRIFNALGYETRVIAVFDTNGDKLRSHSFLDVLNPSTGKWETQDADYDIYWRHLETGERVSLAEYAETPDAIEPCGRNRCGWDHMSREGKRAEKLRRYLDIINVTAKQKSVRYSLYTSRADLGATFRKNSRDGTFCEVQAKRCSDGFFSISNAVGTSRVRRPRQSVAE